MSFSATGARRPLQSKPKQNPFLKRSSSSFSNHARQKPGSAEPVAKKAKISDGDDEPLHHARPITNLSRTDTPEDVLSVVEHVKQTMFAEIPERSAGMNSVTIAKVLNSQRNLAPIVSIAHLHALSTSPTSTDRDLANLVQQGKLRKISVLGRGRGGAPLGDGIILMSDWQAIGHQSGLDNALQEKYLSLLARHTTTSPIGAAEFTVAEVSQLVSSGLVTSTSALSSSTESISRAGAFSRGIKTPVAAAGTTAPTGSHDAIGGVGAVHLRGGGSGGLPSGSDQKRATGNLTFSVPNTGAYLKLLTEARAHLIQLIVKSSPRHKEGLKDLLRERWDGGIPGTDPASRAKRARGEWTGVLPGQTKKWKSFSGLSFDWVLEECLGSGLVECFDTGSVGLGVRVTS